MPTDQTGQIFGPGLHLHADSGSKPNAVPITDSSTHAPWAHGNHVETIGAWIDFGSQRIKKDLRVAARSFHEKDRTLEALTEAIELLGQPRTAPIVGYVVSDQEDMRTLRYHEAIQASKRLPFVSDVASSRHCSFITCSTVMRLVR